MPDRTLAETLAEGRRLIAEATGREAKGFPSPRPWYVSGCHNMIWGDDGDAITGPEPYFERPVANLIVLAVNAFPALLDVAEAAERLVRALDTVHNDPAYRGVWAMHFAHGGEYNGPTYTFEHDALLAALALGQDGDGKEKSNG